MHSLLNITWLSLPAPLLFTVPSAPQNVTLTNSISLLRVMWTIDPSNVLVSSYTIYVTRLEMGNITFTYTTINTQFDIPSVDLDAGELVLVHVSASTSAGEGARSPGVRERTREERKSSQQECCWVSSLLRHLISVVYIKWNFS